jgi:hypothetical protein
MSASLIVLLPAALLGIVFVFCFAGCVLIYNYSGYKAAFTQYSGQDVLNNASIVAYWPLNDTKPGGEPEFAVDAVPLAANGTYTDANNTPPPFFPLQPFDVAIMPNVDVLSAAAPGNLAFGQAGIVPGDDKVAGDPNTPTDCAEVKGGFVSVPVPVAPNKNKFNLSSFTIEAWVRVDWTSSDPQAVRFVLDSRDSTPCTGFGIFAAWNSQTSAYRWQAITGNGGTPGPGKGFDFLTSGDPPIVLQPNELAAGTYLALTYDGAKKQAILYVDGTQRAASIGQVNFVPNTTQPLLIGAGYPFIPPGPQMPGVPLFPFNGAIQDVAVYGAALDPGVIQLHFQNGTGNNP